MPCVLDRVAVAFVVERMRELVGALLQRVGQLRGLVEHLLGFDRASASRFHRRDAFGHLFLVIEGGGQDVAVRHQHHQLPFNVHGLDVLLDHDVVARAHFALVQHLVLFECADGLLRSQLRQRIDGVL